MSATYEDKLLFDSIDHDGTLVTVDLVADRRQSSYLSLEFTSKIRRRFLPGRRKLRSEVYLTPDTTADFALALEDSFSTEVDEDFAIKDADRRRCTLSVMTVLERYDRSASRTETLVILTTPRGAHQASLTPDETLELQAALAEVVELLA